MLRLKVFYWDIRGSNEWHLDEQRWWHEYI